jgi:hypothetical protein
MLVPTNTTGQAAEAAAPRQEAVMGQAIPRQHPAVVLRSHYRQLRALLGVAMIAVVGLTAAAVILATDSDEVASTSSARPIESINSGDSNYRNPSTGYPSATSRPESPGTRFDGAPEEGSADVSASQPRVTQSQAFPGLAREATGAQADGHRYDGGPEERSSGAREQDLRHLRAGGDIPTRAVPGIRYDGGPEEGTSGFGH